MKRNKKQNKKVIKAKKLKNCSMKKYSEKENINIAESKKLNHKGLLKIKDFTKLKSIILKNLELNELEISGCSQLAPKVDTLNYSTGFTSLEISGCSQLNEIDLSKLRT
ncbi:hypothetical protein RhiirA5_422263 [Rhizophagus irregularis]|uniref:Uncharacterized protein n=1 Tax=Rhizophagus irregularis TaxID=588596 RepID=A0A2N0PC86_9GLOM|nr:hypothetical protein RhiirA5_422263 [Rhizophagus irregularis]PKC68436.1 hypothetical protein RhiirA1_457222 [Rhizophagus irregularis]CAB4493600.1 unnamed protein product [Rhizophagus irregularis]CAB5208494.1 unnamed protein product [Rhizophagus irregularis]